MTSQSQYYDAIKTSEDYYSRLGVLTGQFHAETNPEAKELLKEQCNDLFMEFFNYLLDTFPAPEPVDREKRTELHHEIRQKIYGSNLTLEERENRLKNMFNIPPSLSVELLPLAWFRCAISVFKWRVNPSQVPRWGEFCLRFNDLLVGKYE